MKTIKRLDGEVLRRAEDVIAHGALTNSKRPDCFVKGIFPTHLKRGFGCHVWDTYDNKYIDFICGLGANLFGYGEDEISKAIVDRVRHGATLSLGTLLEVEYAERLRGVFPYMERIRILKSGSEGCSAALRIARAYTKRLVVLSDGYHGWHDQFVQMTPPHYGAIPSHLFTRQLEAYHADNPDSLSGVAAIILEPIGTELSEDRINWLKKLRTITHLNSVLLIFDETITGLRFPGLSVANHLGISPDISIMGKALSNGLPISVVGGKSHVMNCDYFVSSTFAGDTLSIAAGLKVLDLLNTKYKIDVLWEKGELFRSKFNSLWPEGIQLEGYPTRSRLIGSEINRALFLQEACRAGILMGPSFFFNFCHIDIVDEALSTFSDILTRIRLGNVKLESEMPIQPFATKIRGNS